MLRTLPLTFLAMLVLSAPALASSITYSVTSGSKSATAEFVRTGSNLVVTLTNTSTADATVLTDILTGVFFNITGDPALSRISAMLPLTSSVFVGNSNMDATPADRVVGGEWAYQHTAAAPPNNGGVSSSGLGVFGGGDLFPGSNLQGPGSPDGVQYGLTSAGDNLLTGNGGLNGEHLIKNSVIFTLGGFNSEPDAVILGVAFQYGTDLSEPRVTGFLVPEPGSFALAISAAVIASAFCRRFSAGP
jgi:hypothetical protein